MKGAITWLQDHKYQAGQINTFLQDNNCTAESQDFSREIIESGANNSLLTPVSFFYKYPVSETENYTRDYPKFTNFLKNEIIDIKNDQKQVINALTQIGIITEGQIRDHLTWGKGPIIRLSDLGPVIIY